MKKNLIIFAVLVAGFISYNLFFAVADDKTNTAINIVYASILFGFIAFTAYSLLRQIKK